MAARGLQSLGICHPLGHSGVTEGKGGFTDLPWSVKEAGVHQM